MKKKKCSKCSKLKLSSQFRKNKSKKDGLSGQCKICLNKYDMDKYRIPERIQIYKENKKLVKLESRYKALNYLKNNPCIDCGENNPIVLDFDHISPKNKKYTISRMLSIGLSWSSVQKEMIKCVIRCANCHRIKTSKEQNWYKKLCNEKMTLSKEERIKKGKYARPPSKNKSSKYKGVSKNKNDKKWWSNIRMNGKLIHLGRFNKEIDAAKAYNKAAARHFGSHAYLNPV